MRAKLTDNVMFLRILKKKVKISFPIGCRAERIPE